MSIPKSLLKYLNLEPEPKGKDKGKPYLDWCVLILWSVLLVTGTFYYVLDRQYSEMITKAATFKAYYQECRDRKTFSIRHQLEKTL